MDNVDRGRNAERLLGDQTLAEAFDGVRSAIVVKLDEVALADLDAQHNLTIALQLLKQVKGQLHHFIATGQYEQLQERNSVSAKKSRSLTGI